MDPKHTIENILISTTELQLATILTRELNERPSVSLQMMFNSVPVQKMVLPVIQNLKVQLHGKPVSAAATERREADGSRVVVVRIEVAPPAQR